MLFLTFLRYLHPMAKKTHDHNGKEIKKIKGSNVRITSEENFNKIRKFVWDKGYRLGWFFEQAALEKMNTELQKETK